MASVRRNRSFFYWLGVDWSSPENRVNDEASDLGGLDLGRERALESFDRHRPSGLRVADELADLLLRDPPSRPLNIGGRPGS